MCRGWKNDFNDLFRLALLLIELPALFWKKRKALPSSSSHTFCRSFSEERANIDILDIQYPGPHRARTLYATVLGNLNEVLHQR